VIDQASVKASGWQRIVAELNLPAADDRAFAERLVRIMAQVSAARQAVLYTPAASETQTPEPRPEFIWPPAGGAVQPESIEFAADARRAAITAMDSGQAIAVAIESKQNLYYDPSGGGAAATPGAIVAIPLLGPMSTNAGSSGQAGAAADGAEASPGPRATIGQAAILGVVTMLIESRGRDAVRSTLAMAEVLAGYTHGQAARSALKQSRNAAQAFDLATRLIGSVNHAPSFKGACMQLVNDLVRQFALDRAALGWVQSDRSKVLAISDIEHFDRRTQMVQKLAEAMDECLDQEQPVLCPAPPESGTGADVLLSQAIVHAHRELLAGNSKLKVCSLPLRVDEDVVGVVTVESAGEGQLEVEAIELLQAALDLVAPVLKVRRSDDRVLPLRVWDSAVRSAAWAVGVKHTVWKLVGIASAAVLAFLFFYTTTYRPGADAILEPRTRRLVSAPFEGVIATIGPGVEPGKRVEAQQLLLELDTTEYRLALADAQAKIAQAQKQADAARAQRQQDKVVQAEQQARMHQAEADVYQYRIERSRLVAPIAGTIIAGDVKDKLGATVKIGDQLLQIADLSDIIITAKVDERDIALVKRAFDESRGSGEIATKGKPEQPFSFSIERIVPLATAIEGKNVFEVRASLKDPADWLRPGMEGIAKFNTEDMSLMNILTRRLRDQLRLWLWW
jgi:Barrel-sandwich domain of CusB or HlyD membrane-fusion/GAF domain